MNREDLGQLDELLELLDDSTPGHLVEGTWRLSTGRTVRICWDEQTETHCVRKSSRQREGSNAS